MKRILVAFAAVLTLTLGLVAPAGAQADVSITATPGNVDAAGEHEITVTGEGYTGPAFLLPCPGAEGDMALLADDGACDLANLTPVTPDADGTFEVTTTFDIPEEGLVIVVGNAAQTEVGPALITVGAEAMAETMEDDGEAEAMTDDASLADTGVESSVLLIAGGTVLIAGMLIVNSRRELAKI